MQSIPKDILEPSMRFNILRIIRIHVAASMVAPGCSCEVASLVATGTETFAFLLDHPAHEVLAARRNGRLGWEFKGGAVVKDVELGLGAAAFFGEEWGMAVQTLLESAPLIYPAYETTYFIKNDCNTPPVTTSIIGFASHNLGRHILTGTNDTSR